MKLSNAFKKITVCAILCCLSVAPLRADDVSGVVNGFVYGSSGGAARNATVLAYADRGVKDRFHFPPVARRITSSEGFFTFLGLLPGRYVIEARKDGYRPECVPGVVVRPNGFVRLSLVLQRRASTRSSCSQAGPPEPPIAF
jgi:hypothetical protein